MSFENFPQKVFARPVQIAHTHQIKIEQKHSKIIEKQCDVRVFHDKHSNLQRRVYTLKIEKIRNKALFILAHGETSEF